MFEKKKTMLIGLFGGFLNGLFGSGGGTIVVLAMEKFLKIKTVKAHATAIAIILPLSIVSIVMYLRGGEVDIPVLLAVSAGGVVGGVVGSKLLKKLSSNVVHKIFGMAMVVAALRMIFG